MPDLAERLQSLSARVAKDYPHYVELAEAFIARLRAARVGAGAPDIGQPLPPFMLPDTSGRLRSLANLAAGGPLVLAFLRGHWCSFCRIQSEALWEAAAAIEARGARIVLITPERARFAAALASPRVQVLCDLDSGYAMSLGLAVAMDPELAAALLALGDDVSGCNGGAGWIVPVPATFVLDGSGKVLARFLDPDYRQRMRIEAILAALAA